MAPYRAENSSCLDCSVALIPVETVLVRLGCTTSCRISCSVFSVAISVYSAVMVTRYSLSYREMSAGLSTN